MQKLLILLVFLPYFVSAQKQMVGTFEAPPAFIKNVGQFDGRNWQKSQIVYGVDYDDSYIFFTDKGLTYRFDKIIRNPDREKESQDSPKRTNISELIHVSWVNSNPDVEIMAMDEVDGYYSYAIRDFKTREVYNENHIPGYSKLVYKNIYDKIDVVYEFHAETGIKYSIILHPGADLSQVKMKYASGKTSTGSESIEYRLNDKGQIEIKTSLAEILEHQPVTYIDESKQVVPSGFVFENDILSFDLGNYDHAGTVVIDPWVQSPNFSTSTAVWEVECDGSGNVFTIGGETPMELRKYNSAGTWQWTYVTPWDTASVWLGTLATDNVGTSFITSGTSPEIERVSAAGAMVWHNSSFGIFSLTEWWSIAFNCDKTKLIVGGTGGMAPPLGTPYSMIYDMDITNGNVLDMDTVHAGASGGFMATPIEIRSISSSKDAKYIFLTHLHVGAIMDNFGACPSGDPIFKLDNGHHLGYKCENYLPATQNGGGLKALIANDTYFYTHSGDEIHQRLLSDGTLLNTVSLPGGSSSVIPIIGGLEVHNSGLAVDDCGNVYAGSGDRVVKFDANLNILSSVNVPFSVYDVSVNSNGEVVAVGAQSDNQAVNRNGKIQSISMSACPQFALVCCDANICPVDTFCDDDAPFNIAVSSPGGTFSGTGITNTATGTFDPSLAGPGSHVITYTQPCGSETVTIVVDPCDPIEVCYDGTNIIASGGTGTIVWEDWESFNWPIMNEQDCIDCPTTTPTYVFGFYTGCSSNNCTGNGWIQFGTGLTVAPPANWPIQISDNNGVQWTFNSLAEIPPCDSCTNPTLAGVVTNVTCSGGSDGAIDLTITPGTGSSYTVSWSGPSGYTSTNTDITGLLAGNYTVTVTDATNSSCFATLTLTVGPGAASANASFTFSSFCQGAANSAVVTGTPGGTFSFNPVPTNGETINPSTGQITGGIGGNTYTVQYTVGSPCPATTTQNVTVYANPTVSISGSTSFCTGGSTTLDAGGGYTAYSWNSGATTQTISVNTAGTYSVTVTTANGCTGTASIAVTVAANLTPNITGVLSICSGAATTLDAGGGYATYLWSTGATTQTINVSTPGTYSVTVSDGAGGTAVFWTEDFQNSCASGCLANAYSGTNGAWTVTNTGANGADANAWFVSGSECGNAAGACGTSCGATDPSLHVGSTTIGNDPGAAYMAGGLGFWFPETDKRVESPTINCTGQSSITLNFNYMENGQAAIDNATLWYYDGAAWSQLFDLTKTATTCAPQGLWTAYSIALPGSADNNPGVKIGFRWVNNDDNVGTDPSFAVDDIELTSSGGGGSCTGTDSVIVTLNNNPTPNITGSLSFCTGGSTILDAGAGYSAYVWSPSGTTQTISVNTAGNYSVTVTDANGCTGTDQVDVTVAANLSPSITGVLAICSGASTTLDAGGGYSTYNWSTGSTSQTISVSTAGTYTVTVSDASGCTGTDQVDVTTNTNPSPSITGALSFCTGNSTTLDAGGGYTAYLWSTGSTNQTINVTTAGNYTVTVSDANGCTGTSQVTVTVSSNLSPNIAGTLAICSGAATTLDAGNGYAAYLWSTGATTQTINVSAGGAYAVTVSDASGCTGTDNVTVTENNNPVPDITGALAFCPGGSTTLNAGGGYSSYNWSPSGNSQTIVVSVAGTYAVTVTDSYGCTGTDQVDVVESSAITLTLTPTDIVCYGQSSGSIDLSVSGGAMPFSYLWSNATTTEDLTNVSAGTYSVTVTDAGGCTGTGSASLTQPGQIVIGMTGNQTICNGESATLTVSVAGGVQPYTYHWSHSGVNSGTVTVSPTSATTYSCYVEDANGCISNTVSATITVAPPIQLSVSSSDTYVCPGDPALIAVVPTAGIGPPYLITFNGDVSNAPFIVYPNQTTTYTITAEDQCGSMASQSITINVYSLPPISFTSDTVQGCEPLTVNFVENSPDMGQTYVWNFGDEDNNNLSYSKYPVHVYDDPGVYDVTLTVTSAEGCVISDIIPDMITVWPKPEAIFIADPEVVSVIKPLIFFTNYSLLNDTNYWAFGDGDSSNAVHPYHQYPIYPTGTYNVELIVATNKGCRDTAYSTIIVKDEFTFYAPTAFSPDFDGTNDYFVVKGNGIDNSNFKLYIYDRWGEIIFESDDLYDGWDGRVKGGALAKNGTYTWLCIYFDLYGTEHQEAGAVTVIR